MLKLASPEQLNQALSPHYRENVQMFSEPLLRLIDQTVTSLSTPEPTKISAKRSGIPRSLIVFSNPPRVYLLCTKKHKDPVLGEGSEHVIRIALDLSTAHICAVAVRQFNTFTPAYSTDLDQSKTGLLALQECQGDHIISYCGHYQKQYPDGRIAKIMILMQYCRFGDLQKSAPSLSEQIKEIFTLQLIQAVQKHTQKGLGTRRY